MFTQAQEAGDILRGNDLINWQNMAGKRYDLRITPSKNMFTVDPVPPNGGAINGAYKLFFNNENDFNSPVFILTLSISTVLSAQSSKVMKLESQLTKKKWICLNVS